ncbi:MAG TPA: hypothetical protein PKD86_13985, partial [Gemmatales bacterium]|nr:hypothetical protein [Gemmatales bacterium]
QQPLGVGELFRFDVECQEWLTPSDFPEVLRPAGSFVPLPLCQACQNVPASDWLTAIPGMQVRQTAQIVPPVYVVMPTAMENPCQVLVASIGPWPTPIQGGWWARWLRHVLGWTGLGPLWNWLMGRLRR